MRTDEKVMVERTDVSRMPATTAGGAQSEAEQAEAKGQRSHCIWRAAVVGETSITFTHYVKARKDRSAVEADGKGRASTD